MNTLYYGDNLPVLREYIADESVDLIYLDPPFNSNRGYNVLFKEETGREAESQIRAFEDTWHWDRRAEDAYTELIENGPERMARVMGAFMDFIGRNQMLAYLVMMGIRLVELHRVLKPTGSLYLHCDPTASHYLKILLDAVFGPQNFRNEIIWNRSQAKSNVKKRLPRAHDVIFFYAKSEEAYFKSPYGEHDEEYINKFYRYVEEDTGRRYALDNLANPAKKRPNLTYEFPPNSGVVRVWRWTKERMMEAWEAGRVIIPPKGKIPRYKRYLDEVYGTLFTDFWSDIRHLQGSNKETLGYPTQKPIALLERIIETSSKPGDVILDPFAGCGTAMAAAQNLDRQWIGIDITHLAVALQRYRMEQMFPGIQFKIVGEPADVASATALAQADRYQFQWWALSLVRARPLGDTGTSKKGKKGSDKGIDGIINFLDDKSGKPKRILVQVKSGHVKSGDIRDLRGVVEREKAQIGVFITLEPPTRDMNTEALAAGYYESPFNQARFPRIQILSIEDLLAGKQVQMPLRLANMKQAVPNNGNGGKQMGLQVEALDDDEIDLDGDLDDIHNLDDEGDDD